jgi:hypothetical protein
MLDHVRKLHIASYAETEVFGIHHTEPPSRLACPQHLDMDQTTEALDHLLMRLHTRENLDSKIDIVELRHQEVSV